MHAHELCFFVLRGAMVSWLRTWAADSFNLATARPDFVPFSGGVNHGSSFITIIRRMGAAMGSGCRANRAPDSAAVPNLTRDVMCFPHVADRWSIHGLNAVTNPVEKIKLVVEPKNTVTSRTVNLGNHPNGGRGKWLFENIHCLREALFWSAKWQSQVQIMRLSP